MIFRSHLGVDARPDLKLRWRTPPMAFAADGDGALHVSTGPLEIEIDRVSVTLRIPFHRGRTAVATIGPFRARTRPFEATIRACELRASGTVAAEGGEAEMQGHCHAEAALRGEREESSP